MPSNRTSGPPAPGGAGRSSPGSRSSRRRCGPGSGLARRSSAGSSPRPRVPPGAGGTRRQPGAAPKPLGPDDVGGQVPVAEAEPAFLAVPLEGAHDVPAVARQAQPNSGFSRPPACTSPCRGPRRRGVRAARCPSAVLTITVSPAPATACQSFGQLRASDTTRERGRQDGRPRRIATLDSVTVQKGPDLADPVDRLAVERRRQAGDHGPEPEIAVRSDRLGDDRRRPEQDRVRGHVVAPLAASSSA